jgi:hypothetical protein
MCKYKLFFYPITNISSWQIILDPILKNVSVVQMVKSMNLFFVFSYILLIKWYILYRIRAAKEQISLIKQHFYQLTTEIFCWPSRKYLKILRKRKGNRSTRSWPPKIPCAPANKYYCTL